MTDDEIKDIIFKIEEHSSDREVRFGYYNAGHEKKIKANKAGLILYASVLLKAGLNYNKANRNVISVDDHWTDENADYFFDCVEKTDELEIIEPVEDTSGGALIGLGCLIVAVLLVTCLITGVISIFQWLF